MWLPFGVSEADRERDQDSEGQDAQAKARTEEFATGKGAARPADEQGIYAANPQEKPAAAPDEHRGESPDAKRELKPGLAFRKGHRSPQR